MSASERFHSPIHPADDPVEGSATSDAFEIDGELSALQAFSVIPFTDSQPNGLGYSNGWTVGPEENRRQHGDNTLSNARNPGSLPATV